MYHTFGFESKNGKLKLCFRLHVYPELLQHESQETLIFLDKFDITRECKIDVGNHAYVLGNCETMKVNPEISRALCLETCSTIRMKVFVRMLKDGIVYHSTKYSRSLNCKRNNTYCKFRHLDTVGFGQIELFTITPKVCVLVRKLKTRDRSIINLAGHPCRRSLISYQKSDLINNYITSVDIDTHNCDLFAIPIENIICKVMVVSIDNNHFCIIQPKNTERC